MKKLICLCVMFLILCGCKGSAEPTPKVSGISFNAKIDFCGEEYNIRAVFLSDGTATFNPLEGELQDFTVTFSGEQITTSFGDIKGGTDLFDGGIFAPVYNAFSAVGRGEYTAQKTESGYSLSGEGFTLNVNSSGFPQSLVCDTLSAGFYSHTIL